MNWLHEVSIKDICDLITVKTNIKNASIENYISTENMLPNFGGVEHAEKLPTSNTVNTFIPQDILFSNIRTYFKKVWFSRFNGTASADVLVFRAKDNCDSKFLYYLMCDPSFIEYTVLTSKGAKMPRGDKDAIFSYTVSLPSIQEQKAIASVLSSLDDKIDLLHRQNKTLESMAETLFRQWFDVDSNDEWQEKNVLDIFTLVGGGTPKTSVAEYWTDEIPWVSGGDISAAHQGYLYSTEKSISLAGLQNSSAKLLPKNSTVISARGTVGKYALLARDMAFSQSNYGIVSKIGNYPFFIYLLIGFIVDDLLTAAYGSVFDTITTRTFESVNLKFPSLNSIEKFNEEISPIFSKKETNTQQIKTLETLRDTLLPKLMSGEVRVQYAEEKLESVA
ncbi:restriction endonuclease subunit S [Escherichia coli]|uniref:restriction endonuclease subunit S n=1 Tax=Escherichia coli TaxID=562 RepID=UPI001F068FC9|nr:restriction endonuclease subunit S [Escherichia coli]MCH0579551.1 restriction endonuclease subunit S [Escherichia coli]MDD8354755.1 restriction endonuclease subunit S [Escherichia coli]